MLNLDKDNRFDSKYPLSGSPMTEGEKTNLFQARLAYHARQIPFLQKVLGRPILGVSEVKRMGEGERMGLLRELLDLHFIVHVEMKKAKGEING